MTRADLLALAARAEAAAGPDRELDIDVHLLTGNPVGIHVDETGAALVQVSKVPAYTGSLDAAASLVPEGWRVEGVSYVPVRMKWLCHIEAPDGGIVRGAARTEPCARTAVALRARASMMQEENSQ